MDHIASLVIGSVGAVTIGVGIAALIALFVRWPGGRSAAGALEMAFWFSLVIALGGLLVLVATRF